MPRRIHWIACSCVIVAMTFNASAHAEPTWPDLPDGGHRFFTFLVARSNVDAPELFDYLRAARSEVVQIGHYGPMFHGYAHNPDSTGYPMRLPVAGERAALERQAETNRRIRDLGLKVVGHFQMSTVVGNPDEPFAFIEWYNNHWDEELFGPKPTDDVRELLQRDADGNVMHRRRYIDFIDVCISSPHTRQMLKRMVEIAVNAGLDGLMSNYNYRQGCACHWCQDEFRAYLAERYDERELAETFGIEDIDNHTFERIHAEMPGFPDPETATELDWAAMDWGYRHFKQVFDEILIEHGRSLNPDLLVATWNHVGLTMAPIATVRTVGEVEERTFTPVELWHRGESYFWYSGSHGTTDLEAGHPGDAWLNLLWLREMVEGKPFMIGKYVGARIRVALAEGVATGGAGTGTRHHFTDPYARNVMARHHNFVHDHRDLYARAIPRAEVGLVLPRQSVLNRQPDAFDAFRRVGEALAREQVLFEVVLDQRLDAARLAGYDAIVLPDVRSLSDAQRAVIRDYVEAGGAALVVGELATLDERGRPRDETGVFATGAEPGRVLRLDVDEAQEATARLGELTADAPLSEIDASWKVRAAAFDLPDGLVLHVVNYDRDESAGDGERRPEFEAPIAVEHVPVSLNLPAGVRVASVTLRSPDHDHAQALAFEHERGRLAFVVPEVEVYGVVEVRFDE